MKTNDAVVLEIERMETSRGGAGGGGSRGGSTTPPESLEWLLLLSWLFGPRAFSGRAPLDRSDRAEGAPRNAQTCAGPPEFLNEEGTNDDTHH